MTDTAYIFPTVATGLGHIRVTRAIIESLSGSGPIYLFEAKKSLAESLHKISSSGVVARKLLVWSQSGALENFFSLIFKIFLRLKARSVVVDLARYLEKIPNKKCVLVCTHFGVCWQIASQIKSLQLGLNKEIKIVLVVTDDSPQKMWAVPVDVIFCPSHKTAVAISKSLPRKSKTKIVVSNYPLATCFESRLEKEDIQAKVDQIQGISRRTNICIPVSGASVHLGWYQAFINSVRENLKSAHFVVIVRESKSNKKFIRWCSERDGFIELIKAKKDWDLISLYQKAYTDMVFSFEVTKPSEHIFKARLPFGCRGGVILLLAPPVGRQEYDNLKFLKVNGYLEKKAFILPTDPSSAADNFVDKMRSKTFREVKIVDRKLENLSEVIQKI